ncbi:MAG TPA: DUF6421 family protein [Solirubrobacteraceae bacterium]|jgi:hypothetical protein|nr:DUF6421 family protein [Solirubrobacteraceae bacterium]
MPKVARVLFDEAHSEAWTIRPEVAAAIHPSHPGDASFARAADALRLHDFTVAAHASGPLDAAALAGADVLVIAHPSEPAWERTVPGGSPRLEREELDAIEAFVARGGGLIVLAEEQQAKYGNNVAELVARFGVEIGNTVVSDYERHHRAPSWVLAELEAAGGGADLLARVGAACFYRATTVSGGRVLARAPATSSAPGEPLAVATEHGAGRVVVLGDSDLFGDDCIDELGHRALWLNLAYWAAGGAFTDREGPAPSPAAADPAWAELKAATDELRLLQQADGSIAAERRGPEVERLVDAMAGAVARLRPHFDHQADYLDAVVDDLRQWRDGGFERPDFARSLALFRPDRQRSDGIEHLVVFPMYLQNASRDTRFEALIVRVPWPEWLARLERTRYDNPKFVPVMFVDHTAGYDSECAVLFPETVSVAGRPVNEFGGIFCDRESRRFRERVGAAVQLLGLNLPPDAAALLRSEQLSLEAYMLWDLVHDRTHSRGDLPFDPFMIRQRSPYWMYSLEELRCDLTAFGEAVRLEREGFAFARHVQYAVLFDRLFRFPITGNRVRNYDGLGGQLLFAYLHKHGFVRWTDNRLTIEWDRVADGVQALRAAIEELYRSGIDRSKVAHWMAAHDLVATYVPPATSSRWAAGRRAFEDESDPRALIDLVHDDEFPLSMFYLQLKGKLDAEPVAA